MVTQLASHPSIVQWVVFNEGWGEYAPAPVVDLVLSLDASRLVSSASGWVDDPSGSVREEVDYLSILLRRRPRLPGNVRNKYYHMLLSCYDVKLLGLHAGASRSGCNVINNAHVRA